MILRTARSSREVTLDFHQLPKIELHLHLDCSLSYSVVSQLRPGVTHEAYLDSFIAPPKCLDLADCLTRAVAGVDVMQTREELRLVTQDLFEQLECDKVIYAEIRFAPLLHLQKGLAAEEVVAVVEAAADSASRANGVEARLLLATLRHYSQSQSLETVKLVEQFRGSRVVGLDIAGDEAGFPVEAHVAAYDYAAARQIPVTAHAGEARGADSVWETIERLRPQRLGHGVRSIEDPSLLDYLREHRIHLEVCPTCNVQTDICSTYADHPIDDLFAAGLSIGVNSDGRTMSDISLSREYEKLHQTFGWGKEQLLQCNLNALEAAFLPESEKQELSGRLRAGY